MLILVVEDFDDVRTSLQTVLELDGHEVVTATNGVEALEATSARLPSAILMDLGLPRLDGLEAARALREREATRSVPMFALSGYVKDPEFRARALAAGFDGCLAKPVDFDALRELLATVSRGGNGGGRAASTRRARQKTSSA